MHQENVMRSGTCSKAIFAVLALLGAVMAQDVNEIDPVKLDKQVKAFLADDKEWDEGGRKDLSLEINRNTLSIRMENKKLMVRYESTKKTLSAQETKVLEEKIDSLVVRPILGDKGGLLNNEQFNAFYKAKLVVIEPAKKSDPMAKAGDSKVPIEKIRKKIKDFVADPNNKTRLESFNKKSAIDYEGIKYDASGNVVVPYSAADGVNMSPEDIIAATNFIAEKIVRPSLGDYGPDGLYNQDSFTKFMNGLKVEYKDNLMPPGEGNILANACPFAEEALGRAIRALKVRKSDLALKFADYVIACDPLNIIAWKLRAMALYDLNNEKEAMIAAKKSVVLMQGQLGSFEDINQRLEPIQGLPRLFLDDVRLETLFFKTAQE
jgi:hypothetical protein